MKMTKSNFKIEKDVPIPKRTVTWEEFPFKKMKVGDSFFVKKETYKKTSIYSLKSFIYLRAKKFLIETSSVSKFSFHIDRQNNGCRVFRIE